MISMGDRDISLSGKKKKLLAKSSWTSFAQENVIKDVR